MKKLLLLLLLLLCVPFIGLGQSFDFNDIKKINSEEMFTVFALENGFSIHQTETSPWDEWLLQYLYNPKFLGDEIISVSHYINWYRKEKLFNIFMDLDDEEGNKTFEKIITQIKSECEFYDFFKNELGQHGKTVGQEKYVCYSCSGSKYKGKIGFFFSHSEYGKSGYIQTFDF